MLQAGKNSKLLLLSLFLFATGFAAPDWGHHLFANPCHEQALDERIDGNGQRNGTFFTRFLLKSPGSKVGEVGHLGDVSGDPRYFFSNLPSIDASTPRDQRFNTLRQAELKNLIIAPGHAFLSDGAKVIGLTNAIRSNRQIDFSFDPLILNIITDSNNRPQYIDTWNGHNRLVAYIAAGVKTVGEIPANNLTILVNGVSPEGASWGHYLPAAGVDFNRGFSFVKVEEPSTLSFDGKLSNYDLGSRTTLGRLSENMMSYEGVFRQNHRRKPKIGIFLGTFDPLHEGHVETARNALKEFGLDEVLFIPNQLPLHKPGAVDFRNRLKMAASRLENEEGMNLYMGQTQPVIGPFGVGALVQRVGQLYGTADMFLVEGTDAMQTLMNLNQVESNLYKYVVFPRSASDQFQVPSHYQERILLSKTLQTKELSSSLMREILAKGETPAADVLAPSIYNYILGHRLYGAGSN